ncbi:carbon-nitrogen hydrolase domain-containing protein [Trichoderma breve]|uniref:Carbon-nitrogen hydrolase domain-containing protein n=1 Tax=Trichoderma breve TaxID=2034170 RepID=A0A9W9E4U8_9HYPO|nr:carbon-nitrogen hydrolase domain-containing protein [Trichoderma breve]KAJ4858229.1 carbon-nitrogen hydrolase domain-containing protein [Trichoderma breve]
MASIARSILKKPVKIAIVQLSSGLDKAANLKHAASQVAKAASGGSKIVVLPECFNSPYGTDFFPKYAETLLPLPPVREQAPSYYALSAMAAENKVYLIGGSIPELNPSTKKHYNTCLIFGPDGALLSIHRKMHLFDVNIPGKITFRESDVLSPGNKVTLVDFPEYGKVAIARKGAFALIYPGAFNLITGALHWKLLAQARAVDNQIYVGMCSPARNLDGPYHAWGHSMILDPMAGVLAETEEGEAIIEAELNEERITETRRNIPLETQRRYDIYPDVSEGKVAYEDPDLLGQIRN